MSKRIAFMLAQLGADAAVAFESAVGALGITPSEAGLLRLIGRNPGISQRAASEGMGVGPSRIVAVLDRLEAAGYVERHRSAADRRSHEVSLTDAGRGLLRRLGPVARAHEESFAEALAPDERERLAGYLEKIAAARGLSAEVHRDTGA